MAGVGPGPFCGMMLADMGATVLRVERTGAPPIVPPIDPAKNLLHRGREIISLDLKSEDGLNKLLALADAADVLLEGFRPGVMERLGLGPDVLLARNEALVYARMTGWGQDGPMAHFAGHDINYFAMSGSLMMCGREAEIPSPNLNMVADMGGGGMLMAFGIVCGVLEARSSGKGQVIDAAMTEGTALLTAMIHGYRAMGRWTDKRGANLLDGGAPFYDVYRTADGKFMAVGSIEPKFYRELITGLGIDPQSLQPQHDKSAWPAMKTRFAAIFASQTRAHWERIFFERDACVTPVLSPDEAQTHPHARARNMFGVIEDVAQPMPAPRFSRTPGIIASPPPVAEANWKDIFESWHGSQDASQIAVRI